MIGRLIWFLLGAGLAVFLYTKIRGYLRQATPEALGQRVVASAGSVGERASDFAARVRAGMAEREVELRETLGLPD